MEKGARKDAEVRSAPDLRRHRPEISGLVGARTDGSRTGQGRKAFHDGPETRAEPLTRRWPGDPPACPRNGAAT